MEHPKLVVVQIYGSRVEAALAKTELESAGIPAITQADTAGGMREHLAWSGDGFQVWVREEDASAARDILAQQAAEGAKSLDAEFPPDDSRPS